MKKAILGLSLLLIILGVTYIKAVRGTNQNRQAYLRGKAESEQNLAGFQMRVDSLRQLVDAQDASFGDSLAVIDSSYRTRIDSLIALLDDEAGVTSGVEVDSADAAEVPDTITTAQRLLQSLDSVTIVEARAYFERLEGELPGDLTAYEARVARYEIRLETAREFSLSLPELKAILEKTSAI